MTQLPDRLSTLICVALGDLEAVEKDATYRVDMGTWHVSQWSAAYDRRFCDVCLAGAVMARTLDANPDIEIEPDNFELETGNKLRALDSVRRGNIEEALARLETELPPPIAKLTDVAAYNRRAPEEFKADLREIAGVLRSAGL